MGVIFLLVIGRRSAYWLLGGGAAYWIKDGRWPNGYRTAGGLMGEEVGGESSCETVGLHIVLVGGFSDEGGLGHGLLDDMGHLEESASSFAESEVDHFVGRIQDTGDVTTLLHRLVSQTEVRETLQVGRLWVAKRSRRGTSHCQRSG